MADIITNRSVDNAHDWDSVGKKKLRTLAQSVVNNFDSTTIGQQILTRLDDLEADIFKRLGRNVVFCQVGDEDNTSQLQITIEAVSTEDVNNGYYNSFFIDGIVFINVNAQELSFGIALDTDVPVAGSSGVSVVERYSGTTLLDSTILSSSMGLPGQLISTDNTITNVVFKFTGTVTLDDSTTADLMINASGDPTGVASILAGSCLSARVQAPAPILPPDPPIP